MNENIVLESRFFYRVLLGLTVLYSLMRFRGILLGFTVFFCAILASFVEVDYVVVGLTGLSRVTIDFTGFYWVFSGSHEA